MKNSRDEIETTKNQNMCVREWPKVSEQKIKTSKLALQLSGGHIIYKSITRTNVEKK